MSELVDVKNIVTRLKRCIGDLLGTFSDGRPALTVEGAEDRRKSTTTGLFCGIRDVQKGTPSRVSGGSYIDGYYDVILIDFDRENPKIPVAKRLIELEFTIKGTPIVLNPSDQNYGQCIFRICSPTFVSY